MPEKKSKKTEAVKEEARGEVAAKSATATSTQAAASAKEGPKEAKAVKKSAPKREETARTEIAALKEGKARDIGVPVKNPPTHICSDKNCAYHGQLSVRGRIFEGTVISDKMDKGVVVEWDYLQALPKYKRFMRKKSRVVAHNPPCINAHKDNVVRIAECRPLSKTKSFVVIEIKK